MQNRWRERLNPAQQAEIEAHFQSWSESRTGGAAGADALDLEAELEFEAYLALQGWVLPGRDTPVEDLLETITADLGEPDQGQWRRPGQQHYTLLQSLGVGDMGQIDLVRESTLQRKVAMKLIKQRSNQSQLRRFLIEAQITAQLEHPHIVPIYSLENTSAGLAYTMKRVLGRTFRELIDDTRAFYRQGRRRPDAAHGLSQRLEYFLAVCDAIDYAHVRGVVHRELEPANLMVGNFHEVYVMDCGSARLLPQLQPDADGLELLLPPGLREQGHHADAPLAGNIAWYSPEQAAGAWDSLDAQSDLYVLGLILFELVSLEPALRAETPVALLELAARAELAPLHGPGGERLAGDLRAIIVKATARAPEARYASVADLGADLRRFLRGEAVTARRDNPLQAASRWLARHQLQALGAVMGLVLCSALLGLWSLWSQQQELARVRAREQALNRFLAAVYAQSRTMNRQFLRSESQLESLASVAVSHLTQQRPRQDPYYLHEHFHPDDLVASSQFHGKISVNWPLSVKTYSLPEAALADKLGQISALRHFKQRLLLESTTAGPLSPVALRELIANTGTTVSYATVVLRQGAGAWLPGGDFVAPTYDPVKRPFYLFGAWQHARRWGNPYIDVSGAGLLLTCATGLWDHQGDFLGTASLDMKFDTIIQAMLNLPPALRKLRGGFLLDEQGRVAIRSSQKGQKFSATIHPDLKLPLYPRAEVVRAIRGGQSGHLMVPGEQPLLVAYYRLPALGWYYVVEAGLDQALAAAEGA
ncbi:MAG TPA: serine/threonine protein kinase [Candidatus Obscuribacterales bacterium]